MGYLNRILDWPKLARVAQYDSTTLAGLCQISPRHLRRFFEATFGKTPRQWLNELRLWDAAQLLSAGHRVKDVAFRLRFRNVSHLCHQFKRYHGCTPKQFAALEQRREERDRQQHQELFGGEPIPPEWLAPPPWTQAERNLCRKLSTR